MGWHQEKHTFAANAGSVLDLLDFDRAIIEIAVDGLRSTASDIEEKYGFHTVITTLNNRASMLERIREGDRLRPTYETVFNQCVVLLVSYFGSAVHGVFRQGVMTALRSDAGAPVAKQTLSMSWSALEQTQGERGRIFADLLIAQKTSAFKTWEHCASVQ